MAKKTEIGEMRSIVRFEVNNSTALGAGRKDDYEELLTTRGKLRKITGSRGLALGEALLESQWELECRFQIDLENNVRKNSRLVIDNRFFTIAKMEVIDQKRRMYKFTLNERE